MKKLQIVAENEFLNRVSIFLEFVENPKAIDSMSFLQKLRINLLDIYLAAIRLPTGLIPDETEYLDELDLVQFQVISNNLNVLLVDNRYYWDTFNPTETNDKDSVCGDLLDDIEDIYKDLKSTFLLYQRNTKETRNTALWQFEFQFRTHWGDHCIDALRACHYFLSKFN